MKTYILRQKVRFEASPAQVYALLMESKKHAAFTGGAARISKKVGGKIEAYDGYIRGKNVELVPDKKIVQEWRASDWPEGHVSCVTFALQPIGSGKTELRFTHTDVPAEFFEDIKNGWYDHYWEPMKEYLEQYA